MFSVRRHALFYVRVVMVPGVGRALLAVFLGALPIGMLNLALLMLAEQRTGSVGAGGLVAAAFGLGNAVGLLVQGRLLDRVGTRVALRTVSVPCAAMLAAAVLGGSLPWLVVLAFGAGATLPAVTTAARAALPVLVADPERRAGAYALLAVAFSTAVAVGPLLVSGFLIGAGPGWAVGTAAVLVLAAAALFTGSTPRRAAERTSPTAGLRTLLVVAAGAGVAAGFTGVAVPAAAIAHRQAAVAGLAFAAMAAGDLCGGIAFGRRLGHGPHAWLARSLLLGALAAAIAAAAAFRPVLLVPVMFAGGMLGAPVGITMSALLDRLAGHDGLAAAYATMVGVGLVSTAGGNALAGALLGTVRPAGLFGCAATALVLARIWASARRRTIPR
jgi:predicted MFS family arabinose efflux permease